MIGDKIGDKLIGQKPSQSVRPQNQYTILESQEKLYDFLLEIVKTWSPEEVITEFKRIFIDHAKSNYAEIIAALQHLLFANQEQEFRNTLKRSCYILVNNWEIARNYQPIHKLVQLFDDPVLYKPTVLPIIKRLREWLRKFVQSQDFQELKLFAARYDDRITAHWSHRYTPYLLVSQYTNLDNPFEQRQAARNLYKKLKEQYKFELAMYTAHFNHLTKDKEFKNPTHLGDEVVHLLKRIVARRGVFNYSNLARIFLNQIQTLEYQDFKRSLIDYLIFSIEHGEVSDILSKHLSKKLASLYVYHNHDAIDSSLLLRTANRLIECLITEDRKNPSPLFILLLSQGASLTLVVVLLKIILMCRYAQTHLEARIADLIMYYENNSEEECQWVIHFLEVFNIAMAIHTENVEYSLVDMTKAGSDNASQSHRSQTDYLENYRIFSQLKQNSMSNESDLLELMAVELLQKDEG